MTRHRPPKAGAAAMGDQRGRSEVAARYERRACASRAAGVA
jgi:hypothetical protein